MQGGAPGHAVLCPITEHIGIVMWSCSACSSARSLAAAARGCSIHRYHACRDAHNFAFSQQQLQHWQPQDLMCLVNEVRRLALLCSVHILKLQTAQVMCCRVAFLQQRGDWLPQYVANFIRKVFSLSKLWCSAD
jgi:hypothetical protein